MLSAAMILAPVPGMMHAALAGQASGLDASKILSSAGQIASAASGANAVMQGANSMSKGKQQMQCCKEGCDGAGKEATANKAAQDADAAAKASALPKGTGNDSVPLPRSRPPGADAPVSPQSAPTFIPNPSNVTTWNFHSTSGAAAYICSHSPTKAKLLFDLFRPQKVEAMAGCNDAMMAMAQGAMQMLSGLAGLAAAAMAGGNANKAGTSASNLAETPTATAAGATGLGSGTGSSAPIQIDPALLRDGKAASIGAEFEKNFGIPRDTFANAVANGADPRSLLMNAPKNAFTADELNQAFAAAKSMSPEQKAAALAGLGDLQKDMSAKMAEAIDAAGGAKSASRKPSSSGDLDDLSELMGGDKPADGAASLGANGQLSPELQAALAARDHEELRNNSTIFQVVHTKYQEKVRMIYGFDAHGRSIGGKGVANADGF